ncbi:tRNA pseudouridine(55) synthase TruB [Aerococcus christensenii]|nr:tRNA pseudouridine(55) synthase TruB [Aerococcus christensenii]MDK8233454.1 tRNA pseudouridine(55) synthase TruB [Aerococcus christensenii]
MDGIIPLWKERGMTSHDCVFRLRKILKTKKVGHTGTLDPGVDGVLVVCVGKATKLSDLLMDKTKTYQGEITLGFQTTTEDREGEEVARVAVPGPLSDKVIEEGMLSLEGWITQIPPMYSAVKVKGRKLYEYARKGESVERPKRQVRIDRFLLTSPVCYDGKRKEVSFNFEVICGKGTYVRTLATDLGKVLGYPATMTQLTRTEASPFQAADCFRLETIQSLCEEGRRGFLIEMDEVLKDLPAYEVRPEQANWFRNGAVLNQNNLPENLRDQLLLRIYDQGELIAIYQAHPDQADQMKPYKMF